MIGGIDHQADIDLYLDAGEISRLSHSRIEGVLVKSHLPKRQGTVSISVNDLRKMENGFGIGINDKKYWGIQDGFHIEVFIGSEWYRVLAAKGSVGTRQRMRDGSKIRIYDRSKLDFIESTGVKNLEHYRDNKVSLPKEFG